MLFLHRTDLERASIPSQRTQCLYELHKDRVALALPRFSSGLATRFASSFDRNGRDILLMNPAELVRIQYDPRERKWVVLAATSSIMRQDIEACSSSIIDIKNNAHHHRKLSCVFKSPVCFTCIFLSAASSCNRLTSSGSTRLSRLHCTLFLPAIFFPAPPKSSSHRS